jgi:hypothetical protein
VKRTLAIAAAALSLSSAALAQSTEATLTEWKLIGTWAADCAKPAARDNIYSRYEMRDGKVVNVHDAGPTFFETVYEVRSAKPAGADMLAVETVGEGGKAVTITFRRTGENFQVWTVLGADGFSPVQDGKYIVNAAPIAPISRCK